MTDALPVIILANTGSPATASVQDVRRYLQEFLSDPLVIPSGWTRWLLRHCIIPIYARKSARRYRLFESDEAFPLIRHTREMASALESRLYADNRPARVLVAMRYGYPSLEKTLKDAFNGNAPVLLIPLFPQYTQATTGSVLKMAFSAFPFTTRPPEFYFIQDFYNFPPYIDALANHIRKHWDQHGRGEKLIFSFHAIPADWMNGYDAACRTTARMTARALGMDKTETEIAYQSAFGKKGKWLQPDIFNRLAELAQAGCHSVDVICPGFIVDNLETYDDIDRQASAVFLNAGGRRFHRISCLNADPDWIDALAALIRQYL